MTKEQNETWTPAKMGRKGGTQRAKDRRRQWGLIARRDLGRGPRRLS